VDGTGHATSGPASDRIDLLTTLTHEFGHLLGMDDSHDVHHVMHHELGNGRRILPEVNNHSAHDYDINHDGRVSSFDALLVINRLSMQGLSEFDGRFWNGQRNMDWAPFDTNKDGTLSSMDALGIINQVSVGMNSGGESEQIQPVLTHEMNGPSNALVDLIHTQINDRGVEQTLRTDQVGPEVMRDCVANHLSQAQVESGIITRVKPDAVRFGTRLHALEMTDEYSPEATSGSLADRLVCQRLDTGVVARQML